MSLMPRKRPEGLIDGCWGRATYCAKCDYEIEWSFDRDGYLCKSCKALESLSPEVKMVKQILEEPPQKPPQTD
jgi:hypothetical protein